MKIKLLSALYLCISISGVHASVTMVDSTMIDAYAKQLSRARTINTAKTYALRAIKAGLCAYLAYNLYNWFFTKSVAPAHEPTGVVTQEQLDPLEKSVITLQQQNSFLTFGWIKKVAQDVINGRIMNMVFGFGGLAGVKVMQQAGGFTITRRQSPLGVFVDQHTHFQQTIAEMKQYVSLLEGYTPNDAARVPYVLAMLRTSWNAFIDQQAIILAFLKYVETDRQGCISPTELLTLSSTGQYLLLLTNKDLYDAAVEVINNYRTDATTAHRFHVVLDQWIGQWNAILTSSTRWGCTYQDLM